MIGNTVHHISFGKGTISQHDENHITVEFENEKAGSKVFIYPNAFDKYLSFEDETLQKSVKRKLSSLHKKAAAEQEKLEKARAEALLTEKRQALYHAASKKRANAKAAAK